MENDLKIMFIAIITAGALYKFLWDAYVAIQGSPYGPVVYAGMAFIIYWLLKGGKIKIG
jgi:hypothetical protein